MWDFIGQSLKVFVEKHLIPTVIAVVGAIAIFLFSPEDFWMVEKLGKGLFLLFVAGVLFLIVKLLIAIWNGIQSLRRNMYLKAEGNQLSAKQTEDNIEKLLSFVDSLSPEDRDLILQFIKNGNAPIIKHGRITGNQNSIYHTNAVVSTENRDGSKQYKLDERFYQIIKAVYEDRGSISHF